MSDQWFKEWLVPVSLSGVSMRDIEDRRHNLTPTTQLVFECCKCSAVHDPETTSFQRLVDSSKAAGWVIKWHDHGYNVTCKRCLNVKVSDKVSC